jgi:hypothetical protein
MLSLCVMAYRDINRSTTIATDESWGIWDKTARSHLCPCEEFPKYANFFAFG